MKRNGAILGFIIGALLPLLGFMVMYFIWGHNTSLAGFTERLKSSHDMLAKVMTMSLLINLVPFALLNMRRRPYTDQIVKGIFIATMIYVAFVLMVKFVW